jgi:hypothetical protein
VAHIAAQPGYRAFCGQQLSQPDSYRTLQQHENHRINIKNTRPLRVKEMEMTMTEFEKRIKKLLSEQRQLLARKSKEGV